MAHLLPNAEGTQNDHTYDHLPLTMRTLAIRAYISASRNWDIDRLILLYGFASVALLAWL